MASATDGALAGRVPGLGGHDATMAGWVTPVVIAGELTRRQKLLTSDSRRAAMLEELRTSLVRLTSAQYGRDRAGDDAIDDALSTGSTAPGRLKTDSNWLARKLRPLRFKAARREHKAWSR